jgi:SAM-dependent methyltransferase
MPQAGQVRQVDRRVAPEHPVTFVPFTPEARPGRVEVSAAQLYDTALHRRSTGLPAELWVDTGSGARRLPLSRWCAPSGTCDTADIRALETLRRVLPAAATVLDLGCGPGRHTGYLTQHGLLVLGVDTSHTAVALTRARGANAVWGDGLGCLPARPDGASPAGRWDAVLLLDGNVGIGGDPCRLLRRVRELLTPTGLLLVELDADGVTDSRRVRLSDGTRTSAGFAWARLAGRDLPAAAGAAGLQVLRTWMTDVREFALVGPVPS